MPPLLPIRSAAILNRRRPLDLAAAGLLAKPSPSLAQGARPNRTIRLVAQFPPGGQVETVSRLLGPQLAAALGQSVAVENRAGAGGLIGTDMVARAPADGYTLPVSHASVHVYAAATRQTMPFDPIADVST